MLNADVVGELGRAANGPLTVDITTTGRRSGEPRRIEIWIVKVGERLILGGSPGPRDWFANVLATPCLIVHLKSRVLADLAASAIPVVDPGIRHEIWSHVSTKWYRERSSFADLVEHAPTVELTFD